MDELRCTRVLKSDKPHKWTDPANMDKAQEVISRMMAQVLKSDFVTTIDDLERYRVELSAIFGEVRFVDVSYHDRPAFRVVAVEPDPNGTYPAFEVVLE